MRVAVRVQIQRDRDVETELLDSTFNFLVENGLENFSMRELCKATGVSIGSIYYWFDNKDELIISAVQYGLSKVADEIFDYVFETLEDLEEFFATCLAEVEKSIMPLKVIYQAFMSPKYGKVLSSNAYSLNAVYSNYAKRMSDILGCDIDRMEALVHIFISVITDYVVCGNYEVTKMSIDYLYSVFKELASNV